MSERVASVKQRADDAGRRLDDLRQQLCELRHDVEATRRRDGWTVASILTLLAGTASATIGAVMA